MTFYNSDVHALGIFPAAAAFEDGNGQTFIDWRDDKLSFPSRQVASLDRRLAPSLSSSRALLDLFTAALNGADAFRTCALYIRSHRVWRVAMFDALKSFIAEVAGAEAPARSFGEEDYRLAAVALLIHVANVDGQTDLAERRRLTAIIAARFGLDAKKEALELIAMAEQSDREAVDFYRFTSILKHALDDDGRQKIVEMLWDIAFADGVVDEFEENTVWRIAELLGVSTRDRVLLRQRVAGQAPREAPFESPWSASAPKGKA